MGKVLCGIHSLLAGATKIPELELDAEEGDTLGDAVKTVAAQYDYIPDEKVIAWVALIGTCASIYGPRIMAYKLRAMTEKEKRRKTMLQPEQAQTGTAKPATPVELDENMHAAMLGSLDLAGKGH